MMTARAAQTNRNLALLATILFAGILPARRASAEDYQSIELTVASTSLVVRGIVVSADVYGPPRGDIDQTRVVVRVLEVLKGNSPDPLIFAAYEMTQDAPIRKRDVGREMLFFLQPSQLGSSERRDCAGCESELATPPSGTTAPRFIDLADVQRQMVWSADLTRLTDRNRTLAAARAAKNIADSSPFVVTLAGGQRIWVPDDGALASRALAWSKSDDPNQRFASVDVLASIDPDRGIPALRRLLDDPWLEPIEECERAIGPWTERKYPIRVRAWRALEDRTTGLTRPRMGIDPGFYRPIPSRTLGLTVVALLFAGAFWSVRRIAGSLRGRKAGEGWEWPTGLCAALIVAVAWTYFRAVDVIDARPGSNRSLTLVRGEIQYRYFSWTTSDQFEPMRAWICFHLNQLPTPWHGFAPAPIDNPAVDWNFAGLFIRQSGSPGPQSFYLVVPSWPLLLVAAFACSMSLSRRLRAMRRAATGLCPYCGYDLRASTGCCPECGQAIAAVPAALPRGGAPIPAIFRPENP